MKLPYGQWIAQESGLPVPMLKKLEQCQACYWLAVARHNRNRARVIPLIAKSCDPIHYELSNLSPIRILIIPVRGNIDDLFHCLMNRYNYLERRGHASEYKKYIII